MRRLAIVICLLILPAAATAAPSRNLPDDMLGNWASHRAACGVQASELAMKVERRSVLFYEHGYEVRRVTRAKDGSVKASGHSVDDSGRVRGSITLRLMTPDILIAGEQTYYRCRQ